MSSTVLLKWQDACEGYADSGKTLRKCISNFLEKLRTTTGTCLAGEVLNQLNLRQILLILGTTYTDLCYH